MIQDLFNALGTNIILEIQWQFNFLPETFYTLSDNIKSKRILYMRLHIYSLETQR